MINDHTLLPLSPSRKRPWTFSKSRLGGMGYIGGEVQQIFYAINQITELLPPSPSRRGAGGEVQQIFYAINQITELLPPSPSRRGAGG